MRTSLRRGQSVTTVGKVLGHVTCHDAKALSGPVIRRIKGGISQDCDMS
ncbi:hypothetical protein [Cypionkella sp.]|nr:hypothetical protein [Cypionkella sp.]